MSRYIDADALREKVLYHADTMNHEGNHEQAKAFNYCLCMIDDMPTADVVPMDFHNKVLEIEIKKQENLVEVVRCKDCTRQMICFHSDDYFCADGERREDGN